MNTNIISLVETFAKTNKIGKAKVEALAQEITTLVNTKQVKIHSGKRGRVLLDKTVQMRQNVFDCLSGSSEALTAKQIASRVGVSPPEATNCLKVLQSNQKVILVGHASKAPNVRGKAPALFSCVK